MGVEEGGHQVSPVRSAYKVSKAATDDKAEPRGFLTLIGSAWAPSGGAGETHALALDNFPHTASHLLNSSNPYEYVDDTVVTPPPIYDSNYYLAFQRGGQESNWIFE